MKKMLLLFSILFISIFCISCGSEDLEYSGQYTLYRPMHRGYDIEIPSKLDKNLRFEILDNGECYILLGDDVYKTSVIDVEDTGSFDRIKINGLKQKKTEIISDKIVLKRGELELFYELNESNDFEYSRKNPKENLKKVNDYIKEIMDEGSWQTANEWDLDQIIEDTYQPEIDPPPQYPGKFEVP